MDELFLGSDSTSTEMNEFVGRTTHIAIDPTSAIYQQLKIPFIYFNKTLFNDELPDCVLTLTHNSKRTLGYFRPYGFKHKGGKFTDEIAMNPRIFLCDDLSYVLSIIVHEMTHMWKQHFGKKRCKGGYHCKEWGAKMDLLGLPPSNTGKPGGRRTGYQMMHYIEKDGVFDKACQSLLSQGFAMNWGFAQQQLINRENEKDKRQKNKAKYSCQICGLNAWAKPQVKIACVTCSALMKEATE